MKNLKFLFLLSMVTVVLFSSGCDHEDDIDIDAKPDLVVTTFEAIGPLSENDNGSYDLPVRVVVENQGLADAVRFKVSVLSSSNYGSFHRSFIVPGQGSPHYPFTNAPLSPGEEVSFTGAIRLSPVNENETTLILNAFADSCVGDEFMEDYCRVDESNENNNESDPITVNIP